MRNACRRLTRTDPADLRGVSHTGGADSEPYESGDPCALPVRDIPARSPAVRMAGQARSHGSGSYRVAAAGGTAPL